MDNLFWGTWLPPLSSGDNRCPLLSSAARPKMKISSEIHSGDGNNDSWTDGISYPFPVGIIILISPESLSTSLRNRYSHAPEYAFFGNAVRDVGSGVHDLVETCIPLALFEVTLEDLDERFRISDCSQEMPETPRKHWQVPYDETLLSSDGMQLLARNSKCTVYTWSSRWADCGLPPLLRLVKADVVDVWTVLRSARADCSQEAWDLIPYRPLD
jgi:hypothetical protein